MGSPVTSWLIFGSAVGSKIGLAGRISLEPLALGDELLERIEQLGDESAANGLALLEGLPEDQREAVKGRVLQERDYAQLADTLACSESVVRQRVSRGLENHETATRTDAMNYIPELRESLVKAAERRHETVDVTPAPTRRSARFRFRPMPSLGGLVLMLAPVAAIAVAVIAFTQVRPAAAPNSIGSAGSSQAAALANDRTSRVAAHQLLERLKLPGAL